MGVYYKCKVCGEEHKAPFSYGYKYSFDHATIGAPMIHCEKSWAPASYDREDLYWKDEDPQT